MRSTLALAVALAASEISAPSAVQAKATAVEENGVKAAAQAIAEADTDRIFAEEAYARWVLANVEILRRSGHYSGEGRVAIDRIRMFALIGSRQAKEAFAQASELTKVAPGDVGLHYFAFALGVDTRSGQTLDELELAARSIGSEEDRIKFRESLGTELIHHFRQPFFVAKDQARIARSADALLSLGWPGAHKLAETDGLRLDVAKGLLVKGDTAGARKLVFSIQSAAPVLHTLISRKWEPVRESGDPNERLAQAIAASDEASERAVRAMPGDLEILLHRAQFLRSVGRSTEVYQLLLPKITDMDWVKERGVQGFWMVNEAAYALVDLNREKEAVSLMEKLLALGLADHPVLISMAINSVGIKIDAGDSRGAADYAEMLATKHANIASPYGRMWMWEGAVCGNAFAGNPGRAQPWLAKLAADEKDNPAALTRALLCMNDVDGVAASVIRRLEGEDSEDMLLALQDYSSGPELSATKKILEDRLRQVVARPDVQAAIAKHGRVMKVPLSRTYWGMF